MSEWLSISKSIFDPLTKAVGHVHKWLYRQIHVTDSTSVNREHNEVLRSSLTFIIIYDCLDCVKLCLNIVIVLPDHCWGVGLDYCSVASNHYHMGQGLKELCEVQSMLQTLNINSKASKYSKDQQCLFTKHKSKLKSNWTKHYSY